jgi:hypothetical protein
MLTRFYQMLSNKIVLFQEECTSPQQSKVASTCYFAGCLEWESQSLPGRHTSLKHYWFPVHALGAGLHWSVFEKIISAYLEGLLHRVGRESPSSTFFSRSVWCCRPRPLVLWILIYVRWTTKQIHSSRVNHVLRLVGQITDSNPRTGKGIRTK